MDSLNSQNEAIRLLDTIRHNAKYDLGPSELQDSDIDTANKNRKDRAEAIKAEEEANRIRQENELRKSIGKWALRFVGGQLIICDVVIAIYIIRTMIVSGFVPSEILIGWMGACLVEIIGILWVIARSLFPFRDESRNRDAELKPGKDRGKSR